MSFGSLWGVGRSLAIYYGQPWKTARMRQFYRQFIQPGDWCFDVGAHVGNRVRAWSSLGANVVAVEPQPQMVTVLQRFYGSRDNVHILPVGLSDHPGTLELAINSRNPTLTTFSTDWVDQFSTNEEIAAAPFDARASVSVMTLDQMIQRFGRPSFCKIDVEGFEDRVLSGLSEPITALSFEAFPLQKERSIRCIKHLMSLGKYQFRTVFAEQFKWVQEDWVDAQTMIDIIDDWDMGSGSGDVYAAVDPKS